MTPTVAQDVTEGILNLPQFLYALKLLTPYLLTDKKYSKVEEWIWVRHCTGYCRQGKRKYLSELPSLQDQDLLCIHSCIDHWSKCVNFIIAASLPYCQVCSLQESDSFRHLSNFWLSRLLRQVPHPHNTPKRQADLTWKSLEDQAVSFLESLMSFKLDVAEVLLL